MKSYSIKGRLVSMTFLSAMIFLTSCEKDVFNPNKTSERYKDGFPVQNIDKEMTWKMTHKVNVNVSVNEDAGVDYSIRLYDSNPLNNSSALLLAQGTANNQMAFTTAIDCPIAQTDVYVCRVDPQGRSVVKLRSIENNTVNVTFGVSSSVRSMRSFATTRSGNIVPQTPDRSEASISALLSSAKELQNGTNLSTGDVYKISGGTTFTGNITTWGIYDKVATVIIEGTWAPENPVQINTGVDLIVMGTGKIILPSGSTLALVGSTRFIAYNGARIEGENATITISNASDGKVNYNAGSIKIKTLEVNGIGTLYNSGATCEINYLNLTNGGSKLINMSHASIGSTSANGKIENGCYLKVTDRLNGDLTMGDNSSAVIANYGSNGNSGKNIIMGTNSMLTIEGEAAFAYGTSFTGPTTGNALVKINTVTSMNGFQYKGGNIYYEVKTVKIDSDWEKDTFLKYLKNSDGVLANWGESPVTIPTGDCTGTGNTPNSSGNGTGTDPIKYTYVFEDNFPLVGDYDFNDIVLDVTTDYQREKKTNAIRKIQLNVTLTAAGAVKTLGAGLRIVGISKSAIKSITTGGDSQRFQATLTNPRNSKQKFFNYNSSNNMEDGDNNVVIPLFNNAHQVFGVDDGLLVNTQAGGSNAINGQKAYTYEIIIELADQSKTEPIFSKDNLDFFICYNYRTMPKRMEVHLYEFWGYDATAAGTVQKTNLELAGNNTWAICVPNFRYPKEGVNISRTSDPSKGAYPQFIDWAINRLEHKDWYLYPNEDKVCR